MCVLVTVATAVLLLLPAGASAHATLRSSTPADDAVVQQAPSEVTLHFTAQVEGKTVQAFDAAGNDLGTGPIRFSDDGTTVTLPMNVPSGTTGTISVGWRLLSEDGHTITGSIQFSVGAPTDESTKANDALRDVVHVDAGQQWALGISRFCELIGLMIAAGGGIFASVIAPTWRPRWLAASILIGLLGAISAYVVDAAIVTGSSIGSVLGSSTMLANEAATPFGSATLVTGALIIVALGPAMILASRFAEVPMSLRWALALIFAALAATVSITGHAVTTGTLAIRLPLDVIHVIAASIWVGGLVQLFLLAPHAHERTDDVVRFSRTAFVCVMALLATGAYATWVELGLDVDRLFSNQYGRIILAKLLLYAATMPLAWNNMTAFVPALRQRPQDAPHMLRQYVYREFALLIAIIALTTWLIGSAPPA